MPSYLDLGLIIVVLISALLAMVRGFTREVLAILSWAAAAVAALYLYPLVLPHVQPYIQKPMIATAVSAAAVFFVTLIIVTVITVKISDVILDSKIGALDRSLGFVFGAARGFLLCVVAFMFFSWLVQDKEPGWMQTSRTKPYLKMAGDSLLTMLPENLASDIQKRFMKQKNGPSDEAPPNETGTDAPGSAPQQKI